MKNWEGTEKDIAMWTGQGVNNYQPLWKCYPLSCHSLAFSHSESVLMRSVKLTEDRQTETCFPGISEE